MDFIYIEGLAELEAEYDLETAIDMLYNKWSTNKNDISILRRLIAECCIDEAYFQDHHTVIDYDKAKNILRETTEYALTVFPENAAICWQIGYMMELFPYLFTRDGENERAAEECAKNLLRLAYEAEPTNAVYEASYYWTYSDEYEGHVKLRDKAYAFVSGKGYFHGNTAIEKYFKQVFTEMTSAQ